MQDTLVILLNTANLQDSSWVTMTHDGRVTEPAICTVDSLSSAQIDRNIIVLVPSADVLLLTVAMPAMSRSRVLQALPFALEDQIIADLDTQHIVPTGEVTDGNVTAAVISHHNMQLWLDQLAEWGVRPDSMLPVSLLLPPHTEKTWDEFADEVSSVQQSSLQDVIGDELHAVNVNLLQGRYAPKKNRFKQTRKITQLMAGFAGVLLVLILAYPLVSYVILSQRMQVIRTQIADIYHREFPDASSVVAPKMRMEEKLHQVTAQLGSSKFLLLTAYVGKALQGAHGVSLKRLQFQANRLTLEVNAQSAADFSTFTTYLSSQGLSVKQQNANIAGARVSAIVEVE